MVGWQITIAWTEILSELFYHLDKDNMLINIWISSGLELLPCEIPFLLHTSDLSSSFGWSMFFTTGNLFLIIKSRIYRRPRIDPLSHSWKQIHYSFDPLCDILTFPYQCSHVDLSLSLGALIANIGILGFDLIFWIDCLLT